MTHAKQVAGPKLLILKSFKSRAKGGDMTGVRDAELMRELRSENRMTARYAKYVGGSLLAIAIYQISMPGLRRRIASKLPPT
jgi:hypothetical protein